MKLIYYILIIQAIVVTSCINNKQSSTAKDKIESASLIQANIAGFYSGNLPCVDCEYIRTNLELKNDNSYVLSYMYVGKSDEEFVREGNWNLQRNKIDLKGIDYKFKVDSEALVQLDLSENEITGDLADQYKLVKER